MGTVQEAAIEAAREGTNEERPASMALNLIIEDLDLIEELLRHPEGIERERFAIAAMKIGILAFKHAQGRVDSDSIRNEADRLLELLEQKLNSYQNTTQEKLVSTLTEYFDPNSGRFSERVHKLIKKDGELEQVLLSQIGGENSQLSTTLASHVGEHSPLMKLLNTDETGGFLKSLAEKLDSALTSQRQTILKEFSLDNDEGALRRLVNELETRHGKLEKGLEGRIDEVVGEFSLNNEDSALSRLVKRVEQAQQKISSEFSLDQEQSALARLSRELKNILEQHRQTSDAFQTEVKTTLAELKAKKQESERSTRHGLDFEEAALDFVEVESQKLGDVLERTGNTTGQIKNCKKGDGVLTIGQEAAAAGARIVLEMKEDASYDLKKALEELGEAKKNRTANVGVFVFSKRTAPDLLPNLARHGDDVVVVWDSEDTISDSYLHAALSLARALCTRAMGKRELQSVDFTEIDKAVREIEKQANYLGEIETSSNTIVAGGNKILERVRTMRNSFQKQIQILDERIIDIKDLVADVNLEH